MAGLRWPSSPADYDVFADRPTIGRAAASEGPLWVDPYRWATAPRTAGIGRAGAIGQAAGQSGLFTGQRLREPTPRRSGPSTGTKRVRFWPLVDPARRGLVRELGQAAMIRRQVVAPSS